MPELIFVIDPMCSWCWGFHPVMEELRHKHSNHYKFSLVAGGLRTTGEMTWNEQSKAYLKQNWDAVAKRTGQPFSHTLLNRSTFDYNTYPTCKALVVVRELWGDEASFDYLSCIQKAFYADGIDITSLDVLTSFVTHEKKAFQAFYKSERAELLMQNDFSKSRSMGANAFPSVVKIDEDGHMVCLKGYRSAEEILTIYYHTK